ncbi:MAG: hypothetical protein IJE43_04190 [Alphaproteobacteria bacterium]|nr:hypothetical protein [Alphaproteobacteria bacterium]MBQ3514133.1 hypothetical protein [Lachnospiraceae bacterium]
MGKRWSKLQARLYNLMELAVNFQIHCALYEMKSLGHYGSRWSRYFITGDKEIVFDYPKDMELDKKYIYLWNSDVDKISNLIEEYIQRPKDELFEDFPNDKWGIVDILRACDRRVGKKRLQILAERTRNENVRFIIEKRGLKYEP